MIKTHTMIEKLGANVLQKVFQSHLVDDDRSPIQLLDIWDYRIGLLLPEPVFFLQVIILLLIQMVIANGLAVLCYYGIIINKSNYSITPFLITFGVVLPLTMWTPFVLMDSLDIRSTVLRMGLVALPICVSLTCLQAYFGYTPMIAKMSLHNFRCQMGFLMNPIYNIKDGIAKTTLQSFRQAYATHIYYYLINAILYSILAPVNYQPFHTKTPTHEVFVSIDIQHLCNNFIAAVLVSLSLCFSLSGVHALVQLVGGFRCQSVVDSPLFQSTSPSDFWGRRWNKLVHDGLKNGIYKPIRRYTNSQSIATVATFLVSGLIHEYVWCVLFYTNAHQNYVYMPSFGKSMLFFGWNGVLLVLEYAVKKSWRRFSLKVPKPLVTVLVILLALPVGHLFTGDLVVGGYFQALQLALPMIVVTKQS